jgi:hypothetical protein
LKVHGSQSNTQLDEYFMILFKAVKSDDCIPRVTAFLRRMLQMAMNSAEVGFIAASLILISEIFKTNEDIRIALFGGEVKIKIQDQSSDEEHENFVDFDK